MKLSPMPSVANSPCRFRVEPGKDGKVGSEGEEEFEEFLPEDTRIKESPMNNT